MKFHLGQYHVVHNFPPNYPLYKKIMANFIFFFSGVIVHPRKNLLSHADLQAASKTLRRGDIVLVGNLRTILHSLIKEEVTHSAMYVGRNRFIHSVADGVSYISLYKVFSEYDTLVIVRVPKSVPGRLKIIQRAIKYARTQYGMPYDFEFKGGAQSFFCTKLVNEAYKHAGFDTKLLDVKRPSNAIEELEEHLSGAVDALKPSNFLDSKFDVIFLSHNLKLQGKKLEFIQED